MSIIIKGMEMPQRCKSCRFCGFGGRMAELNVCMFTGESQSILSQERMSKCPLVPVPPHGRLIDADALKAEFPEPNEENGGWRNPEEAIVHKTSVWARIDRAPTIIPAEEG